MIKICRDWFENRLVYRSYFPYGTAKIRILNTLDQESKTMTERFEDSPEYDDWIEETGGRDEDCEVYEERYNQRKNREIYANDD